MQPDTPASAQNVGMTRLGKSVALLFWLITLGSLAAFAAMALFWAPTEASMGDVQRIFYLHLPVAINAFAACAVVFIASVGYLWHRRMWWDSLAHAGAQVAVVMCFVVLLTGSIWGHSAWGQWWAWTPRLTFSLVLFLLYVVYLTIRPSIQSPQRRAVVSAVYGMVAFLDVPLVYFSVKLMPDIHPTDIALADPRMQATLAFAFVPVTLLTVGLIWTSFRLNQQELEQARERQARQDDAAALQYAGGAL